MENQEMIIQLDEKITRLRQAAEDVLATGGSIEAVKRNITKILANTRMLELNVSDVREL
ncbi:MAG: hypothetical protein QMD32_05300 [Smithellaceae bacterium]|nr:hypothetical protein [Smithellaceae bacterium]